MLEPQEQPRATILESHGCWHRWGRVVGLAVMAGLLTGCVTAINGSRQHLAFTSDHPCPVYINGQHWTDAPGTTDVIRGASYRVRVGGTRETPVVVDLHPKFDWSTWLVVDLGPAVLGGVIGTANSSRPAVGFIGGLLTAFVLFTIPVTAADVEMDGAYMYEPRSLAVDVPFEAAPEPQASIDLPASSGSDRLAMAVLNLEPLGVSGTDAAVATELVRQKFVAGGTFRVVERAEMDKILREQALQASGCTSTDCSVKLGKLLNVRVVAAGSFGKLGDTYFLTLRLVDVETGAILYSGTAKGADLDGLEKDSDRMRGEIRAKFRRDR